MKIWLCLAAALPLAGCYTQLYTAGYAERTVNPYPYDRPVTARDSAVADSLDSVAAADTLHQQKTVIVNNYYDNSPSYRGYSIDAWDYPFISFGFYSGRYRDYYGPYWWNDDHYHRGHARRRYYDSYPGGGTTPGPYHSERRIFAPSSSQPPLNKGRRNEPAQAAPAAKTSNAAPAESSKSSSSGDGNSSSGSSGSSGSSSGSSGNSNGSGDDHPDVHKGRRR